MELTKTGNLAVRGEGSPWPNTFIFPKELRDAIPNYGARAFVFDEVSGAPLVQFARGDLYGDTAFDARPRVRVQFIVHETGKLEGRGPLYLDVDSATLRSLGRFLVNLAGQADEGTWVQYARFERVHSRPR